MHAIGPEFVTCEHSKFTSSTVKPYFPLRWKNEAQLAEASEVAPLHICKASNLFGTFNAQDAGEIDAAPRHT